MICALIPAKGTSERITSKNLQVLRGRTLVEWAIKAALEADLRTYVSTESRAIAQFCQGATIIPRPLHLCRPDVTDLPVISHFLDSVGKEVDLLVYLRPTTPWRDSARISEAIHLLLSDTSASGLRSVQLLEEPPGKCFHLGSDMRLDPVASWRASEQPGQEHPQVYKPNGYVDICRGELPPGSASPWGEQVIGYVTDRTVEIDEPDDLKWAHYLYPLLSSDIESRWPEGGG